MGIQEDEVNKLEIDGPRQRVYIKFVNEHRLNRTSRDMQGKQTYKHDNGEQSQVIIELAGLGRRDLRIANLPPEVNNRVVIEFLIKYGEVLEIKEEYWTSAYRYKIANGIRLVQIKLKHHLPSRLVIAGHTVDVTYTGQPQTCFSCHQTGHIFQQCPHRRRGSPKEGGRPTPTWANIAAKKSLTHCLILLYPARNERTHSMRRKQTSLTTTINIQLPMHTIPTVTLTCEMAWRLVQLQGVY
jgi:hypothetical protein